MQFNPLQSRIIKEDCETIYHHIDNAGLLKNKSVFITGASGMLASYLTYFLVYLNEAYHFNIDIYAGIRKQEKAIRVFGSICDKEYFHIVHDNVIEPINSDKDIDFIIHAASLASPQYYGSNPVEVITPNVIGTYQLLEYARTHKIDGMLFFSSGAVYGDGDNAPVTDENSLGHMDYLQYGNMYGESKQCGEMLCKAYSHEYGVHVNSARIYHTYAPTMDISHDKRVFAEFVKNAVNGEDIVMKSDGSSKRAFCYITDGVEALIKILLSETSGECYNMGNPNEFITIRQLAETICRMSDDNCKVVFEKRSDTGYSAATVISQNFSTEKLSRLGWTPKVGIEQGFQRCIAYQRALLREQKRI